MADKLEKQLQWHLFHIEIAKMYSTRSKDPSTQVGAIAVSQDRRIISAAYNGFPRNILDLPDRWQDRETKYKYVVHAEENLICNAAMHGNSLKDTIVYVSGLPPCSRCARLLCTVQISEIVFHGKNLNTASDKWRDEWNDISAPMFNEALVQITVLI